MLVESWLCRHLTPRTVFMVAGERPYDSCEIALRVAGWVERVYALDVPAGIARSLAPPCNVRLGDAVPDAAVDIAYSAAVPDLHRVYRALAPGGVFYCGAALEARALREAGFGRVRRLWFAPIRFAAYK